MEQNLLILKSISFFNTIILLTAILIVVFYRVRSQINAYLLQSIALTLLCFKISQINNEIHLYLMTFLTFIIKCIIIPYFLFYISRKTLVLKDNHKFFKIPFSLIICGILIIFSFGILKSIPLLANLKFNSSLIIALSLILIGLFLMINRTLALTQIIGILLIENGLFLSSLITTLGMPLIVEMGIFFDVIVGVIIMGIMTNKINKTFDTLETDKLNLLKH